LQPEERPDSARPAEERDGRERENRGADGERRPACECADPVEAHDDPGRRETVEAEESGHGRERRAHEDGAAVFAPDADGGEEDCGRRRRCGRDTDPDEMQIAWEVDLGGAEEMRGGKRNRGHGACQREHGYQPISHQTDIGRRW
jgi:hypothetical protein